jgi:hypothetical protein
MSGKKNSKRGYIGIAVIQNCLSLISGPKGILSDQLTHIGLFTRCDSLSAEILECAE